MPQDLLNILFSEFKALDIPIINYNIINEYNTSFYSSFHKDTLYILDFTIETSEKYVKCFSFMASKICPIEQPYISFEDLHNCKITNDISGSLTFKKKISFHVTSKIILDETKIYNFIKEFRERTELIRLDKYNREFDKEVQNHLSEYNNDDGHK